MEIDSSNGYGDRRFDTSHKRKYVLAIKGIPYEIDPIVAFYGNKEFSKLSSLHRIPVFTDDKVTLCDSSVICQYLEDCYPSCNFVSIYPNDIVNRVKVRCDQTITDRSLNIKISKVLQYFEENVPKEGYMFGKNHMTVADISIACFFRNLFMVMLN
ncbi:unnamed protein product [Rotaria sordida]|uniref:GST N-terminal domain-containing protein n=2 Tax=Rotaria sordida TaxID=392033 RepID=A0A814LE08_9BILA|nr:unnamed protein product [Rotaria sordida]CAF1121339.1 unnamed protein product [Rotaria sordida]CAF1121748.1 unnamed protein product [Rotaria sordida]CAF3669123.1 unnamed protein product [Rotaria sordida]CAF3755186.1 unnamed protein product [Rotaria sordida]